MALISKAGYQRVTCTRAGKGGEKKGSHCVHRSAVVPACLPLLSIRSAAASELR
jgi:hypothetical protein